MPDQNETNEKQAAGADTPAEAAPPRRRRAASRPAGPPAGTDTTPETEAEAAPARRRTRKTAAAAPETPAEAPAEAAAEGEEPAAPKRRRATRKATAPAASAEPETAEAPEQQEEAASAPRAQRRATRKAESPAASAEPETAEAPEQQEEAAPAPRARRRATRKAESPAVAEEAPAEEEAAPKSRRATRKAAAPAASAEPEAVEAPEQQEEAAPAPRARRRATRKAESPAASAEAETAEAPAEEEAAPRSRRATRKTESPAVAEEAPAEEAAPAPRARRRATRAASAPSAETAPAPAAESAPAPAAAAAEPTERPRRTRKKAAPAATFSAGDSSRRLKPGALAPREEEPAAAPAAAPTTDAYTGRALRDGDGWAVEVDDAYEIRGYGDTPEEAAAMAVTAIADAFGIPAERVVLDVRTEPEPPARGRRRAAAPATSLFQPPVFVAPTPAPAVERAERTETPEEPAAEEYEGGGSRRRRRRRGAAAVEEAAPESVEITEDTEPEDVEEEAEAEDAEGDGEGRHTSRRRRRGGRRRRRGDAADHAEDGEGGSDEDDDEHEHDGDEAEESDEHEDGHAQGGSGGSSSSRRRRRRRRRSGDAGADDTHAGDSDDPERTVVRVREPRPQQEAAGTGADQVQSIKGSTRLEAKKQRRREGREQGRRRVPIITEAEFLARREAVERVMVVRQNGERTQIGVLEDNVLVEHYVNKEQATSYVGNVYLGKVQNVLPSMEAAFVDIGKGRNAVLYAGEVNFEALGLSGGPRRIESALKSGQPVLVQVTKDPIGHKGARLTSQVSLPGRYLVYVPEGSMTGISRKLPDTERARLKTILKKIVPEDAGVIVRTAAEGASEDELRRDVERLQAQWDDIQRKAKQGGGSNAPTLLYGEPDMTVRVVRDIFNEDFSKVIVSGDDGWETIHDYVAHVAPDLVDRLSRWTSETDVFATYRIDEQLLKALDRKVWLPSGGSLVIDKTEAMVVVDVNTGKFTGQGGNLEETVTRNNLEAAEEIVRQLRLRDLGGIVVIDFIDMVLESNRDLVMRRLLECLGRDRTKHQVAEVTSLGLVQMTRKRVGQGLLESFSETCVHCNGRGVIVHMDQATTVGGGGGKRKRRGGKTGADAQPHEHEHVQETEAVEADEVPELEPIEVGESDLVPAVGDPEEEWFGTAAEAEAAANQSRGRTRRRGARKATAPAGAPAAVSGTQEEPAVVVVPVSEPDVEPAAALPEPEVSTEPPARTRRRATRKATAPAGAPPAAEEAAVVVVAEAAAPAPAAALPEPEVSTEPPARTRRRATRKVTAPAGSPAAAEEAAVVVVPATAPAAAAAEPEAAEAPAAEAEPKKRTRKAPAKKAAAKKTATKKAAAKKTTTKKAAAKKTATPAE
ncbi:Rne/Rng family ribonuclease [Streptomyces sp. NPDC021224]|uniref:Rne/Rng family ribonuclease n=1 Tax=unclassified Streptomyces TaxID=2593676 RepID=UPI00378FA89F